MGTANSRRLKHGLWGTRTYRSWNMMLQRTRNSADPGYANYGGRGIRVCERWHVFANFVADMGERPEGTSLDRIDVNGNYEPGNCRWATRVEQSRNTRATKLNERKAHQVRWLTEMGYSQREVGRMFGVSRRTVRNVVGGLNW